MARRGQNEGSIYKRGDRWVAAMSTETGRRKYFYGKTRAEVDRKLTKARRDRELGIPAVPERERVGQFLTAWLETMRPPTTRQRTWEKLESHIRVHILPALGKVVLAKLSPKQVQQFYSDLLAKGLHPNTVRGIHATLHRAIRSAYRMDLVQRNVTELVDRPQRARRRMQVWSPEEVDRFLTTTAEAHDRLEAMWVLALTTGMRLGEMMALRWRSVDLEAATLSVVETLQRVQGEVTFADVKTASSRRQIALPASTVEALRAHRVRQVEERLKLGPIWQDLDLVFCNTIGGPLWRGNLLWEHFRPLCRRAGVPVIRIHDLRHTAATLRMKLETNPKIVSEMLGHASVAITLDLYSHVDPGMQREAADKLDRLLKR